MTSLFIAGLAYTPVVLNAAKLGILAGSICSAAIGILVMVWLTRRKRAFPDAA